jgi:hypothetical protein
VQVLPAPAGWQHLSDEDIARLAGRGGPGKQAPAPAPAPAASPAPLDLTPGRTLSLGPERGNFGPSARVDVMARAVLPPPEEALKDADRIARLARGLMLADGMADDAAPAAAPAAAMPAAAAVEFASKPPALPAASVPAAAAKALASAPVIAPASATLCMPSNAQAAVDALLRALSASNEAVVAGVSKTASAPLSPDVMAHVSQIPALVAAVAALSKALAT